MNFLILNPSNFQKLFLFLLVVFLGAWILSASGDIELYFSQSDHGRDLYAFQQTFLGQTPYRDYLWEFGPLMPYYYASFFHFFGVSIQTILWAQNFLILLSGVFFYLIGTLLFNPCLAFIGALWFWAFQGEFFYTYNHSGAVLSNLIIFYFLVRYLKKTGWGNIFWGCLWIIIASLIRPNIGVGSSVAFFTCLYVTDIFQKNPSSHQNARSYSLLFILTVLIILGIYWIFLHPLSWDYINQCLHYGSSVKLRNPSPASFLSRAWTFIQISIYNFTATWPRCFFAIFFLASLLNVTALFRNTRLDRKDKIESTLIFLSLGIFALINLHEFLLSGYYYRLNWSLPFFILLILFIIHLGMKNCPTRWLRSLILLTMFLLGFLANYNNRQYLLSEKKPENLLHVNQNKIYIINQKKWLGVIENAVSFLQNQIPDKEPILALPNDALYYFLSNRRSLIREIKLPQLTRQQQENIIDTIKKNRIRYILISNDRYDLFNKSHQSLLSQFITDNFLVVTTFGDWNKANDWVDNHALKFFKKK